MTAQPKPISRELIAKTIDAMRDLQIEITKEEVQRDEKVKAVSDKYAASIGQKVTEYTLLEASVIRWADENRAAEFGESKSLTFDSGAKIQFRMSPKRIVYLLKKTDEMIIAALRKRKLNKFITVKYSVNKTALLAALGTSLKESVAKAIGITTAQDEATQVIIPMATAGKETS